MKNRKIKRPVFLLFLMVFTLSLSGCGAALGGILGGILPSVLSSKTTSTGVVSTDSPTLTSLSPNEGSLSGGTVVTITGTNFNGSLALTVGGQSIGILGANSTQIAFTSPAASSEGTVDVTIQTTYGSATKVAAFTYYNPPTISSVTPSVGPSTGGTSVTVTGTHFIQSSTTVTIGGTGVDNLNIVNSTTLTFKTKSDTAGTKDVKVITPGGTATQTGGFSLYNPPTVTSISPSEGPISGGTSVTLQGSKFVSGNTTVTIGGVAATGISVTSTTTLTALTGAATGGTQDVVITTPGGTATLSQSYTYRDAPSISKVTPAGGPTAGGTSITIEGSNFLTGNTTVTIGGAAATNLNVTSFTSLTCTTPAGTEGLSTISITTSGGTNPTGNYIYDDSPPTFLGINSAIATSPTSVLLRWNAASDNLSTSSDISYLIYYSTKTGGQIFASAQYTSDAGETSFTVPLLLANTTYFFVVRAQDGAGNTEINFVEVFATTPAAATISWSSGATLSTGRWGHTATLLPNGKILISGGYDGINLLNSTELYDPHTGTFSSGSLALARRNHTATVLTTGKVLIVGGENTTGFLSSAELYDPVSGTSSFVNSLNAVRTLHTATRLSSGKVLILGGRNSTGVLSTAELFDPSISLFTKIASMTAARQDHTVSLLPGGKVLIVGGRNSTGALNSAELYDSTAGTFTASTGTLTTARYLHSATLMNNGKLLIVSGAPGPLDSLEIYDPSTDVFSVAMDAAPAPIVLSSPRSSHTAALLPSGHVVIVGGIGAAGALNACEIYDPNAGTITTTGTLTTARYGHTSTLLLDGTVQVIGGTDGTSALSTTEVYKPHTGQFISTNSMNSSRAYHTTTFLPNGKVLIAGGSNGSYLNTAELYDPSIGTFSTTGNLNIARGYHTATLLSNGKVLITGGYNGSILNTAELYDPSANSGAGAFSLITATLLYTRWYHTATLLPSGKVLIAGGNGSTAEIFDPNGNSGAGSFSATGDLTGDRFIHTATLLENGTVLLVGGLGSTYLNSAEIFDPAGNSGVGTFSATGSLSVARYWHSATLLPNGKVLIVGGYNGSYLNSAELYDPNGNSGVGSFSSTGNLNSIRSLHSATLLVDGRVLLAGGTDGSNTWNTAEIYEPARGTFSSVGSMSFTTSSHKACLLPSGRVLITGGYNNPSSLSSANLFDPGRAYASSWRPRITSINTNSTFPVTLTFGTTLTVEGTRLLGLYNGVGGQGYKDSKGNHPTVILQSIAGSFSTSRYLTLSPTEFTSTSLKVTLPISTNNPPGYYMMVVIVNGIPSMGKIIKLQ